MEETPIDQSAQSIEKINAKIEEGSAFLEQMNNEIIEPHENLYSVIINKKRTAYTLNNCNCEVADIKIGDIALGMILLGNVLIGQRMIIDPVDLVVVSYRFPHLLTIHFFWML